MVQKPRRRLNALLTVLVHSEASSDHRGVNEDFAGVRAHPRDATLVLCALADGQGGQAGGAAASRLAVETCLDFAANLSIRQLGKPVAWYSALSAADEAVRTDNEAGFTTLVCLAVFANGRVVGTSCGDSAAYLVNGSDCQALTENQRKSPPVGSGGAHPVAFESRLRPGDRLLICSDGVWRYVGDEGIAEAAAQPAAPDVITSLRRKQTDQNRGVLPDDFSVILVENP